LRFLLTAGDVVGFVSFLGDLQGNVSKTVYARDSRCIARLGALHLGPAVLPSAVRIAAEELPSGEYNLDLWTRPLSERYPVHAQPVKVRIEDGRNTCVLLTMPADRITGAILLGGADRNIIPAP